MKLLRRTQSVAVVLAAAVAAVAWTCPADFVYAHFAEDFAPLRLREVSGTVWQGRAEGARLLGRELGAVDWRLQPLPLLHGEVVARVSLAGPEITAAGIVTRRRDEAGVRDARLTVPARLAAPALAIPALDLLGTIDIDVARAVVHGTRVDAVQGSARWRDAAVAGAVQARIGDLLAAFASAGDGTISGDVKDAGGPLAVAGTFKADAARYRASVRLVPRGDDPQLAEALLYVGQPQADGSRLLEIEGRQLALSEH